MNSKAAYVRQQAQVKDPAHHCHADGCTVRVSPALFMCRPHWRKVPARMQKRIWREYRKGQEIDKKPSANYIAAAKEAIAHVANVEALERILP